jgi:shikimate kinase
MVAGESRPPCRVVLIGMMGSGKSTIGRLLADKTGWPYYDNDVLLAMLSGETAKGLLAHDGVAQLREGEAGALHVGLSQKPPCIVGAPAGTILDGELRDALKRESLVVWLTASASVLARRARGAAHRPWLGGDAVAWMTTTLEERGPLYEAVANLKVSTERRRPDAVAAQIAAWLEDRCG